MEQKRGPAMHSRTFSNHWQKSWKLLRTPTLEVVAAIVVVLFAAWIVVDAETTQAHNSVFPVPFVHR
jgi:hypothetical protein